MKTNSHERRPRILTLSCYLLFATFSSELVALTEVAYPSGAPVWNVITYGATPNDSTDDTAAIQACINAALADAGNASTNSSRYSAIPIIYVPNGTYRITDTLYGRDMNGLGFSNGWRAGFHLQGESEGGVRLEVPDNHPNFNNASAPRAVLKTGSENPNNAAEGTGGQAFRHYIKNLTVDVGHNNAGAIGIDFLANNRGGIYNVTIASDGPGFAGLLMDRGWPGPAIVKHLTVEGFDYGISLWNHYQYSMTFEHISISGQNIYGFRMKNNTANLRDLISNNSVTAIFCESQNSHFTLIDGQLTGGSSSVPAIDTKARTYLRNVTTTGYAKAVEDRDSQNRDIITNGTIDEYFNSGTFSEYTDAINGSLRLPIKETPTFNTTDFSKWGGVDPGTKNDDDLARIQAAIDSGKEIVYLPVANYKVSNTIILRGNVEKFIGLNAGISKLAGFPANAPLVRFDGSSADSTIIEHIRMSGDVEQNSAKTLAIVNSGVTDSKIYNTASGTGDVFVEDCMIERVVLDHPVNFWGRQLNMEFANQPFFENNAGTVWLFGYKTEGKNASPIVNDNAILELFGGFFYSNDGVPADPMIINRDGQLSANYKVNGGNNYAVHVRDIRGGTTKDFLKGEAPSNNNMPIYSSATAVYTPPSGGGSGSIVASHDAHVQNGSAANTNFGSNNELLLRNTSGSAFDRKVFLKFDLSSLTADVTQADLILYVNSVGNDKTVDLKRVGGDGWSQGTITWNNSPSTGTLLQTFDILNADAGGEIAIDVTNYVNTQRSDGLASFCLEMPGENNIFIKFSSSEGTHPPKLELNGSGGAPSPPTPPVAPSGLSATATSASSINLAWNDDSSNEQGFLIESKISGGSFSLLATLPAGATSYSASGLLANTTYVFRVKATSASDGDSAWSFEANATTDSAPSAGAIVSIAVLDSSVGEPGNGGRIRFTRSGSTGSDLTVYYTLSGSASDGFDYTGLSGSWTIPAGNIFSAISFSVIDDSIAEGNESIVITLVDHPSYDPDVNEDTASFTLVDDD